ncbi:MAG: hypothetical protein JXQ82_07850 [Methanomicrobiaceae archaeon]|nr:hypothetical protein [Methanomicrobiaceae archaeon]
MSEAMQRPSAQVPEVDARTLAAETDIDTLLETAWFARETELQLIDDNRMKRDEMERSEKWLAAQQAIAECEAEFADSVKDLNARIDNLRALQAALLERAQELGIESKVTADGTYKVVQKTIRTVIPERFRQQFGDELFNQLAEVKIKIGEAEKVISKEDAPFFEACVKRNPQGAPKIEFVINKKKTGVLGNKGVKA